MVLRTKSVQPEDPSRQTQRVPLPHESLFVLGERTNMRWLHGIRQDKRPNAEKSVEDRAGDYELEVLQLRSKLQDQEAGKVVEDERSGKHF